MDEKFNNSILRLNNNAFAGILVETKDGLGNYTSLRFTDANGKATNTATCEILTAKYGSVENFFEELYKHGVTAMRITDRKKNGANAYVKVGESYEFTTSPLPNAETKPMPDQVQKIVKPTYETNPQVNYGMNGGMQGLGAVDAFKLINHDNLKEKVTQLEAKLEASEKEVKRLYEENLRNDIQGAHAVQKSEAQTGMMAALMPLIQPFAQTIATGMQKNAPGLSSPAKSPVQQQVIDFVCTADDTFLNDLHKIGQRMLIDEEFDTKIVELLST
jgi:hypothetical protein